MPASLEAVERRRVARQLRHAAGLSRKPRHSAANTSPRAIIEPAAPPAIEAKRLKSALASTLRYYRERDIGPDDPRRDYRFWQAFRCQLISREDFYTLDQCEAWRWWLSLQWQSRRLIVRLSRKCGDPLGRVGFGFNERQDEDAPADGLLAQLSIGDSRIRMIW